ncbi:PMT-domain-containing protein [Basidiobolus meristosporus CBS 931.73]|uniref:Dolichyl-phosphate-mannose--protein mannosyltransferase n=1 Tax=Basidiobolus meristosporus CBS 931.73 TaxID=1314790 RepID=A0A1Y1Y3I9_9FUNG|nr:PMT-domain-containing protein [Basidiobolus meristosporus CBS 931.73]|eukprot:ORX92558.1 PMT-domain-containing protein [Basidiobolus meristosporus CBS 931.73]
MVWDNLRLRHKKQQLKKPVGPAVPDDFTAKEKTPGSISRVTFSQWKNTFAVWGSVIFLTSMAIFTRFYQLGKANKVVWDEAHFGKFGSYYLRHEFYHDVHPPLGKMLVGLGGYLAGYDGSYNFNSGENYPENLDYLRMRQFTAAFGALMIPLSYWTCLNLGYTKKGAFLCACMVLMDTTTLTISRFILLDPILLCFTASTLWGFSGFRYHHNSAFSLKWWSWLVFTGVSIGCVASVKWVGLFTTAWVGVQTIEDLWVKFGDYEMPKVKYVMHWLSRVICLILIPFGIYVACFKVHFSLLTKSGKSDGVMSSLFQANLEGSDLKNVPLELAYGSSITLRSNGEFNGLLHSHAHFYPTGSHQQQVTIYGHKDENNNWFVLKPREESQPRSEDVSLVKNGDLIRLAHVTTGGNLHSHGIPAPLTEGQFEASAYGNSTFGDTNDYWYIEILDDMVVAKPEKIRSLTTRFRLRHRSTGCVLRTNTKTLPEWGYGQGEVTCDPEGGWGSNTIWNIESHQNEHLPKAEPHDLQTSFWADFLHLNHAMWKTNNALVPDSDRIDKLASAPVDWPLLNTALRMCSWGNEDTKYWLIGHPVIWWGGAASIVIFASIYAAQVIASQRNILLFRNSIRANKFLQVGKMLFTGWFLHYFPFFLMGRVTYLHHYFPALYYAIFMTSFLIDFGTRERSSLIQWAVLVGALVLLAGVFVYFAPFAFGFDYPAKDLESREWLRSWELYDP